MPSDSPCATVLLVDRDPAIARDIMAYLSERGYEVEWVDDGEKAYNHLDGHQVDVLITDLNSQRIDGMRLMAVAKERNPEICVVLITEEPDIELATEAMRQGAVDFQTKPLNLGKLEAVIEQALGRQKLVLEQHELKRRLDERYGLDNLVGQSPQMMKVYEAVRQIAPTRGSALIRGETGTGKDLIAQAIHNNSPRRDAPFVKLNCANLPEALVESELFGHVSGAFTGAVQKRTGRFEVADKGTLFLDEIGELSLPLQAKLLRVLEQQQFERLGDNRTISVDVRLIAATNRSLEKMMETGQFRDDLYYRLRVVSIEVPPLRDRREDIPLLTHHFLKEARDAYVPEVQEIRIPTGVSMKEVERIVIEETMKAANYNKEACAKTLGIGLRTLYRKLKAYNISTRGFSSTGSNGGKALEGITRNAMDVLMRYDWPGNVRELKNIIEGMVIMARSGAALDVDDLPEHIRKAVARRRE
ncbi:MAG: sigma 54-interacting transcriptional regulator [Candidatus Hydrogenedentota bacterium]